MNIWNINKAWISNEGSSGVIFVNIFNNKNNNNQEREEERNTSTYVLKGCSRIAEELFSNK